MRDNEIPIPVDIPKDIPKPKPKVPIDEDVKSEGSYKQP